ncbi:MAG: hypothetical protein ABSG03_37420 [Bryobacteraceae bacterium]|jgi:bifunctional non-homologous end joining protein LigD
MPDETVVDGEIVALDESSFNALQNHETASLIYYVFDVMILAGKDVMNEPLSVRRELLQSRVMTKLGEPIRESPELDASLPDLISSVKAHGLEGLWQRGGTAAMNPASARVLGRKCASTGRRHS